MKKKRIILKVITLDLWDWKEFCPNALMTDFTIV